MQLQIRFFPIIAFLLCLGWFETAGAFGVMYAQRLAGGSSGGFFETFCTGLLPQTAYSQGPDLYEANDSYERSGTMTNEVSVSLGSISMQNSGTFSNEVVNALYAGSVLNNFICAGGLEPNVTQWNDTMTITGSGQFAFTVILDSKVEGAPLRPNGTATTGVDESSRIEAQLNLFSDSANREIILTDMMNDGDQTFESRSETIFLNATAGNTIELAGSMKMTLFFGALLGTVSWDIDAGSTATFFIDPVSPGASYTTESGVSYLTPTAVPLPAGALLFGSALGLFGLIRRKLV